MALTFDNYSLPMIHKTFKEIDGRPVVQVTFSLPPVLQADRIYLVGDFNGWDQNSHPFGRDGEGNWFFVLDLEPGRSYEFRYWLDGYWMNDGDADAHVNNTFGATNFVVNASVPPAAQPSDGAA